MKEIIDRIETFTTPNPCRIPFVVSGNGFEFVFQDVQVEILDLISRSFYTTWQEASVAAQQLGIRDSRVYDQKYKMDPQLPSSPDGRYPDFPGWEVFLGTNIYPTWQEASKAAQLLGCRHSKDYRQKHKMDSRLRHTPEQVYADFPGWFTFLAKERQERYTTWQEASIAVQRLGIRTQREYNANYQKNKKLWSSPRKEYPDFPGWSTFLGKADLSNR